MIEQRTKPVVIIKPGDMSKKDVARMNKAGITVVEANNPESIRFLDPPPYDREDRERAAIGLCRILLTNGSTNTQYYRSTIAEMYVKLLLDGSSLDKNPVPSVSSVPPTKK